MTPERYLGTKEPDKNDPREVFRDKTTRTGFYNTFSNDKYTTYKTRFQTNFPVQIISVKQHHVENNVKWSGNPT